MKNRFDIHCHVFNKDIISRRIIISALYELSEALEIKYDPNKSSQKEDRERFLTKLRRIANFLRIGFKKSSLKVFETLKKAYPDENFIFTPLMFDLKYCFQEEYDTKPETLIKNSFQKQNEFDILITKVKNLEDHIHENQKLLSTKRSKISADANFRKINFLINRLKNERKHRFFSHLTLKNDIGNFEEQIDQMIVIKKKYPKNVFPFFVVDPRRPGILELMKIFVGQDKPFYGIKLYTPNGYSPADPVLFGKDKNDDCVYKYCIDNDIPITVHNSAVGFSNFVDKVQVKGFICKDRELVNTDTLPGHWVYFKTNILHGKEAIKERALTLNYPLLWELVLERYNNLRLNLAHFGTEDEIWTKEIYRLLNEEKSGGGLLYPNLYTDFSCFEADEIKQIKTKYFDDASEKVKAKFLYGSDFYLNMLSTNSMKKYYKNFTEEFSSKDFDIISIKNPKQFLKFK
ncbi:MAG: hypothetical protein GXO80_09890 [Chlorobi bacterium]|nr:hypothetical protein [Chlorobiota bacterium]